MQVSTKNMARFSFTSALNKGVVVWFWWTSNFYISFLFDPHRYKSSYWLIAYRILKIFEKRGGRTFSPTPSTNRVNITLKKGTIKNLYPESINSKQPPKRWQNIKNHLPYRQEAILDTNIDPLQIFSQCS